MFYKNLKEKFKNYPSHSIMFTLITLFDTFTQKSKFFKVILSIFLIKSYLFYMKLLNDFYLIKDNIKHNIMEFKKVYDKPKICAIVKADAYGHGIEGTVNSIKGLVDFFGVADSLEAVKVRAVTSKPILVLSMVDVTALKDCITKNISLSVSQLMYLRQIEDIAKKLCVNAKIHLKINSGMNRLGFCSKKNFLRAVDYINKSNFLVLEGIYTHFFDSLNQTILERQYNKFNQYLSLINTQNIIIHAGASNASITSSKYHFDMVRLGLLMYGYSEKQDSLSNGKKFFNLLPALKVTARIVNSVNVKKGNFVGYGRNYIATHNMKIACVSMGYADGFLRTNSNRGRVIIKGKFAPIVGSICMDLFMVDISDIKCKIGDEVVVLGKDGNLEINANEIAQNANTIPYEILTNFKRDRMNYHII